MASSRVYISTRLRLEISRIESSLVHSSNLLDWVSSTISVCSKDILVLISFSCMDFQSNQFHFKIGLINIGQSWIAFRVPEIFMLWANRKQRAYSEQNHFSSLLRKQLVTICKSTCNIQIVSSDVNRYNLYATTSYTVIYTTTCTITCIIMYTMMCAIT
jgi:hypothetical protein